MGEQQLDHSIIEQFQQGEHNKLLDNYYDQDNQKLDEGFTALQVNVQQEEIIQFIDQNLCSPNLMVFFVNFIMHHSKTIQQEKFIDLFEYNEMDEDQEDEEEDTPFFKKFQEREDSLLIREMVRKEGEDIPEQKIVYLLVYFRKNHWLLTSYRFEDNQFEFCNFKEEIEQDVFQDIMEACIQYLEEHYDYLEISEDLKIQKKTSFDKKNTDGGPGCLEQLLKYCKLVLSDEQVSQVNNLHKYKLDNILLQHLEEARDNKAKNQTRTSIKRKSTLRKSVMSQSGMSESRRTKQPSNVSNRSKQDSNLSNNNNRSKQASNISRSKQPSSYAQQQKLSTISSYNERDSVVSKGGLSELTEQEWGVKNEKLQGKKERVKRKDSKQFGDFYIKDQENNLANDFNNNNQRGLFTPESDVQQNEDYQYNNDGKRQKQRKQREKEQKEYEKIKMDNIDIEEGFYENFNQRKMKKLEGDMQEVLQLLSKGEKELQGVCRNVPEVFLILQKIQEKLFENYKIQNKGSMDFKQKEVKEMFEVVYQQQKQIKQLKKEREQGLWDVKQKQQDNGNQEDLINFNNILQGYDQKQINQFQFQNAHINNQQQQNNISMQEQDFSLPNIKQQQSFDLGNYQSIDLKQVTQKSLIQQKDNNNKIVAQRYRMTIYQQDYEQFKQEGVMNGKVMSFMLGFIQEKFYFQQFQEKYQNYKRVVVFPIDFYDELCQGYFQSDVVDARAAIKSLKGQDNTQVICRFEKYNIFEEIQMVYVPIVKDKQYQILAVCDIRRREVQVLYMKGNAQKENNKIQSQYIVQNLERFFQFVYMKVYRNRMDDQRDFELQEVDSILFVDQFEQNLQESFQGLLMLGIVYADMFKVRVQQGIIRGDNVMQIGKQVMKVMKKIGTRFGKEKLSESIYSIQIL